MDDPTYHPYGLRWLSPLIQAEKIFHSNCRQHGKARNMYCIDCLGDPICPSCCDAMLDPKHKGHTILQIFNTTHKKAVRDDIIKVFMDSSDIQKLINNGHYVICIGSRLTNKNQNEVDNTKSIRCKTCTFRLPAPDFQFCSIHCKVKEALSRSSLSDSNFSPSSTSEGDFPTSFPSTNNSSTSSKEIISLPRQRPRKQKKPSRSPFK